MINSRKEELKLTLNIEWTVYFETYFKIPLERWYQPARHRYEYFNKTFYWKCKYFVCTQWWKSCQLTRKLRSEKWIWFWLTKAHRFKSKISQQPRNWLFEYRLLKMIILREIFSKSPIDILCIDETKIESSFPDAQF